MAARKDTKGLLGDDRGTVMVLAAAAIGALVGIAGLSSDLGRLFTTNTEAKAAADAAALAAASQLDRTPTALARAELAARQLVTNRQSFAASGDRIGGTVQITGVRFLSGLPPRDYDAAGRPAPVDAFVTNDPRRARFAEVTTQVLTQNNLFIRAVGAARPPPPARTPSPASRSRPAGSHPS